MMNHVLFYFTASTPYFCRQCSAGWRINFMYVKIFPRVPSKNFNLDCTHSSVILASYTRNTLAMYIRMMFLRDQGNWQARRSVHRSAQVYCLTVFTKYLTPKTVCLKNLQFVRILNNVSFGYFGVLVCVCQLATEHETLMHANKNIGKHEMTVKLWYFT